MIVILKGGVCYGDCGRGGTIYQAPNGVMGGWPDMTSR